MKGKKMITFFLAIALLVLWGLIELNVWYYRERAKMTQEERQAEDHEMGVW